jgi:RimJ/RimL family protein N-acetyltransferase
MLQPGEKLPDSVLSLRLPLKMDPTTLIGHTIKLVPLDISRDAKQLFSMINGDPIEFRGRSFPSYNPNELIWKNFVFGPFLTFESFKNFLEEITSIQTNLIFCLKDIESNTSMGIIGYADNEPSNLKVKLRFGILSPIVWGTVITIESAYLLLKHVFDLGYRRVEGRVMSFNYRSTIYSLKLGYRFEGIMQYYYISKGISYDAFGFSILDFDWKYRVKASLEQVITNSINFNPKL